MAIHFPVLLKEVIESLNPQPGQKFIDATADGGGHALRIIEKLMPGGKFLGIEWDDKFYQHLKFLISNSQFSNEVTLVNDSYVNLKNIAETHGFTNADGILFDLGMSSWHLAESGKGFSFQKDETLDMRYNTSAGETAAEIINQYPREEIERILTEYGEEKFAGRIAEAIIKTRKQKPIISTFQLMEVIKTAVPFWYKTGRRIHCATKTFQALRIAVNHELENMGTGLAQATPVLKDGGHLAVITFHSLEDRIVKNFFREQAKLGNLQILTKKPIRAGLAEITENSRARSAKLRIGEKV